MKLTISTLILAFAAPALAFVRPATFTPKTSSLNGVAEGKVVLITGAAQGLGQAMAVEMAQYKSKIVVADLMPGDETVEKVKAAGGEAIYISADITNAEAAGELFDKAFEEFGTVDVVVNNAGITKDNLMLRMKPSEWQAVLNVNLSGVFFVSQAYFKKAIKKKISGRVINIASVVGQIGNPGQANYSASKGGVIALTKTCAKEFARRGFKVNAICPGYIETAMTAKLSPEVIEKVNEFIPLGRMGKPTDIAAMARFLALDDGADYITGHCFDVDGGAGIGAT
jgi:3-oxoacyl-[acyl-carrier protein] reductase